MTLLDYTDYDTRLAAYAVITAEADGVEQVLLAYWNQGHRWTLPGGGVELHETPEEGVVREVLEETGYDVVLGGLLGIGTSVITPDQRIHGSGRPLRAVRVFYTATVVGGELTHEVDGTTDEARWFPLAEVERLTRTRMVDEALKLAGR